MTQKYMDLDNLLLYEPRKKGKIPNRFNDFKLSFKVNVSHNVLKKSSDHQEVECIKKIEKKSNVKKQVNKLLPTTNKKTKNKQVKKSTKKNNVPNNNTLFSALNKITNREILYFYRKKIESESSDKKFSGNKMKILRYRVPFSKCKPIINSLENYHALMHSESNSAAVNAEETRMSSFLKFQPIVLIKKMKDNMIQNSQFKCDNITKSQEISEEFPELIQNGQLKCDDSITILQEISEDLPELIQNGQLKCEDSIIKSEEISEEISEDLPSTKWDMGCLKEEVLTPEDKTSDSEQNHELSVESLLQKLKLSGISSDIPSTPITPSYFSRTMLHVWNSTSENSYDRQFLMYRKIYPDSSESSGEDGDKSDTDSNYPWINH